jgi:hypothetical protein
MPYIDPDNADPRLIEQLARLYEQSAARLKAIVLNPPGSTDASRQFNHARAAGQLAQVNQEIARLKKNAADWIGPSLKKSVDKGIATADEQAASAGLRDSGIKGSFDLIDRRAIQIIAADTYDDIAKSADSMGRVASRALRRMADNGLTRKQVNDVIARGIIEGKPDQAIKALQADLQKIHGEKVVIPTRSGGVMTFDTDYYGRMVANSRMREATVKARHERLIDIGADLVKVIGRISKNPCSLLLNHIFSLSGKDKKYPAFSTVSDGQLPYKLFHPNCSKSTAPFIEGLSKDTSGRQEKAAAA